MARRKSTLKKIAEDFAQEVKTFTDENDQINEDMIGAFLEENQPKTPPKLTL